MTTHPSPIDQPPANGTLTPRQRAENVVPPVDPSDRRPHIPNTPADRARRVDDLAAAIAAYHDALAAYTHPDPELEPDDRIARARRTMTPDLEPARARQIAYGAQPVTRDEILLHLLFLHGLDDVEATIGRAQVAHLDGAKMRNYHAEDHRMFGSGPDATELTVPHDHP